MLGALPQSPPYSEESERAILGGILLDPAVLPDVSERIKPEDFYLERHQVLYRAMLSLADDNIEIDLRTVQAKLEQQGRFESAGGISYLATLDLDLPDIGRIDAYTEIVKERSVRRRLIQTSGQIIRDCLDGGVSASEALGRGIESLEGIHNASSRGGWMAFNDIHDAVAARLEADGYTNSTLPTGLPDLDRLTGGMPLGNIVVLAARPGCGKSSMLSQIIEHNACRAREDRVPCAIVNLEMTNERTILRMIARRTGIPLQRLLRGGFQAKEWAAINEAHRAIRDASIWLEETTMGVSEIVAAVKKLRRKHGVKLVGLDYLGLMKTNDLRAKENRTNEIAEISRRLAELAKHEEIVVLSAHQLNRVSVERRDQRPDLHHLAESGAMERDASLVIMNWLELDERGVATGNAELLVRKHRDGEPGIVECLFDGPRMLFKCKETRRQP